MRVLPFARAASLMTLQWRRSSPVVLYLLTMHGPRTSRAVVVQEEMNSYEWTTEESSMS